MGWTAYKLVYQAKSPIHIGWHTLGYIKLTRYYITGKSMWGAMTANLTRAEEDRDPSAYERYGKLLKTDIRISYFYPMLESQPPLLPKYTPDGLVYGDFTESIFEKLFIKSFGQTAILPESNSKEDESLHESEFIVAVVENETTKLQSPVYFVGYIFIKDDAETEDGKTVGWDNKKIRIKKAVSEIFVGGDRKYGWGRLMLDESRSKQEEDKMFDYSLNMDNEEPWVTIPADGFIPAHLDANGDTKLKGDIEPLVGREWGEVTNADGKIHRGFGQRISKAEIYWMPGSIISERKGEKPFEIGAYGILK